MFVEMNVRSWVLVGLWLNECVCVCSMRFASEVMFAQNVPFDLFQTRFVLHKALFSAKVIFLRFFFFSFVLRSPSMFLARCLGLKMYLHWKCVLGG